MLEAVIVKSCMPGYCSSGILHLSFADGACINVTAVFYKIDARKYGGSFYDTPPRLSVALVAVASREVRR